MDERRRAEDDDAALVRAARGGDRLAFAALLGRYRPLLVALCRRMLTDPWAAEDAAQEAMLQAFLGLAALRQDDRFGAWLGGIGLNVCRMLLRQRGPVCYSWEDLYGGRAVEVFRDEGPGPAELAETADLRRRVLAAVEGLPRGQRAAVLLFYLGGLSRAEVAAQLGIDPGAAKTRLHKARSSLRRTLWTLGKEENMIDAALPEQETATPVTVVVDSVRVNKAADPPTYTVILKEVDGPRYLLIWVGQDVSHAIAMLARGEVTPRPLTYTLMANLLTAGGMRLQEVRVTRLAETVFYAIVVVDGPTGRQEVDARPSDAIGLALASGIPIHVEEAVLAEAGFVPPQSDDQVPIEQQLRTQAEAEERRMRERQGTGEGR